MAVLIKNNAVSRLASTISTGANTLSVQSGEGSRFPSPVEGEWFPVTVLKSDGTLEIMKCTERNGDVLSVSRAQEGTAAQAFTVGDRVELRITMAVMAEFLQNGDSRLGSAATKSSQASTIDETVSALMMVGAFGLGGIAVDISGQNLNITQKPTGFYSGNNITGAPDANFWFVLHFKHSNDSFRAQIFIPLDGNRDAQWRVMVGGAWQPMRKVFDNGNFNPNAYLPLAGGTLTGFTRILENFEVSKNVPRINLLSQGAVRGYRILGNVTDTVDLGLNIERFNGKSWDVLLTANASNLIYAGNTVYHTGNLNLAGQLAAMPIGGIGTFAMCVNVSGGDLNPGDVIGGGSLRYAWASGNPGSGSIGLGNWRLMGDIGGNGNVSLFLRIN